MTTTQRVWFIGANPDWVVFLGRTISDGGAVPDDLAIHFGNWMKGDDSDLTPEEQKRLERLKRGETID